MGAETDLDLATTNALPASGGTQDGFDQLGSGSIPHRCSEKERRGDYLGQDPLQVIPTVKRIKDFLPYRPMTEVDFMLCEIGGTVGAT